MKALALAAVLAAGAARAQGSGSEAILILAVGPPALVSIAVDFTLLSSLVSQGTAGRGRSITALVFATIGGIISGICLGAGLGSSSTPSWWLGISAGALTIEVGTLAVGVYGLIRGEPESEIIPEPDKPRRLYKPPGEKELPPQLFNLPFTVNL